MRRGSTLTGSLFAATGAFCYGVTIVFSRSLAKAQLPPATALGARFGIAAAVGVVLVGARRGVGAARLRSLALGLLYGIESTFFYMALQRGTAAAVTLLFYSYPAIVTGVEIAAGRERPSPAALGALALCTTGAGVVAAAGGDVSITTAGIALSFAAAAAFTAYLVAGDRLLADADPVSKATWVVTGCAAFHLLRGLVSGGFVSPDGYWPQLVGNGVATALAFAFMFAGLSRVGPARTAVVMTLEAVFGVALAAVFLGESLRPLQLVGGAAVLAGAALAAAVPRAPAELALGEAGTP